ncbi:MAG: methyl-accepting chemotaxis protein [Magnetococcales bacterium]|nr:methyl-accepting chemotaxis protein [Magnetococcales bacterium]
MRNKITVLILLAGVLPLLVIAGVAHYLAKDSIVEVTLSQLESIRSTKRAAVEHYFSQRKKDIALLVQSVKSLNNQTNNALEQLRDTNLQRVSELIQARSQDLSILSTNKNLGQTMATIDWVFREAGKKTDGKKWQQIVQSHTPWLDEFRSARELHDLYLVSRRGDLYFSSGRGDELGINLKKAKDTPLGQLFEQVQEQKRVILQDHSVEDAEGKREPLLFIGTPVTYKGNDIGMVAIALSPKTLLSPILTLGELGESGRSYLVGPDKQWRTDPLNRQSLPLSSSVAKLPISLEAVDRALAGESDSGIITNGKSLRLAAWRPLEVAGQRWAVITETDPNEAFGRTAKGGLGKKYLETSGYYDLFLIKPNGLVFHTAAQQRDYGTNLLEGPFADSNLSHLFQQVMQNKTVGLTDVAAYKPSNGEPSAFIAAPLLRQGEVEMVVALQLPLEELTQILRPGTSLGPQGDIYLVGSDRRMRSDSSLLPESHSLLASFSGSVDVNGRELPAVDLALAGETGTLTNPSDTKLYAYAPVFIDKLRWALILETGPTGGGSALSQLLTTLTFICLGFIPLVALLAWVGANNTVGPLAHFSALMAQLSQGNFAVQLKQDNLGDLGNLGNQMVEMTDRLGQMAAQIRQAATRLIQSGLSLSEVAENQQSWAGGAFEGGVDNRDYTAITRAIQDLDAILKYEGERALSTEQAAELTSLDVAKTNRSVNEAVAASRDVSERIFVMEETSRQIRLLAMNAAVEAARSGSSGEPFIEMAKEMRTLAEQNRVAASEIHRLSTSSTQLTKQAGQALSTLSPSIRKSVELIHEQSNDRTSQREALKALLEQVKKLSSTPTASTTTQPAVAPLNRGISQKIALLNKRSEELMEALASFIPPRGEEPAADTHKEGGSGGNLFDH